MKAKKWILAAAIAAGLFHAPSALAQQANTQPATTPASTPTATESQETNLSAYVELLRADVKAKKIEIFTEIMQFNDEQATKFWPIYREYDLELQKLNDRKLAGIQDYAKNHANITDEKADELAKLALELESQRNDLKKKYYEKIREQLGGKIAARYLQVENQLLMVIDLQIASMLPIVE